MMTAKLSVVDFLMAVEAIERGGLEREAYARCHVGEDCETECWSIGGDGEDVVPDIEDGLSGKLGKVSYSIAGAIAAAVRHDFSDNHVTYDVSRAEKLLVVVGAHGEVFTKSEMEEMERGDSEDTVVSILREYAHEGRRFTLVFQDMGDLHVLEEMDTDASGDTNGGEHE